VDPRDDLRHVVANELRLLDPARPGVRRDTGLVTARSIRLRRWSPDDAGHDRPTRRREPASRRQPRSCRGRLRRPRGAGGNQLAEAGQAWEPRRARPDGEREDWFVADELRDSVVDPVDLVLYYEARRCLNADAYRAAYVMSWIAAAEGILGKLRTMATHHAALGTFVGEFEAAQRAGTAKDAELVAAASKFGLIDDPERIALEAMRDLRNQYGHPTAASPDRATAEHALRTAVTAVLAKPPLMTHGAAKELAKRAATDRHLVPADEPAIKAFTTDRAAVIHRDARPIFVRELMAGADERLQDPNGEMLAERCIRMTTIAIQNWAEPLLPPRWNVDQLQQNYPAAVADAFADPAIWPLLAPEDRDRLLSRCLDDATAAAFTRTPGRLLARADDLWASGFLAGTQETRVRAALESADPRRLLGSGVRFEHVAHVIVRRLDGRSFPVTSEGVQLLRSTKDHVLARLDDNLQFELGRALAYAANRNAFDAINEIEAMTDNLPRWPAALRRGVVVGGLTGKGKSLHHVETSKAALRLALTDPDGDLAQAALDALTSEKTEGRPKPSLVDELRAILDNAAPSPAVEKLATFIERVEPPARHLPPPVR